MGADLACLMALRVQGISTVDRASIALRTSGRDVAARLTALVAADLAVERTGKLAGFTLTPLGIEAIDALLGEEGLRTDEQLHECYERFMQLNPRILRVSTDWQVRSDAGADVPNDHSDPAYDAEVIGRLLHLHDRAHVCIDKVAGCAARFAPYVDRLDACAKRLNDGDHSAFTAPLAESYHTVWFELHQDLLLTLGLKREA